MSRRYYKNYYQKKKPSNGKFQKRNEFRKHKPSGHYKYIFQKVDDDYRFLGLTHCPDPPNIGPIVNPEPNPSDTRPVYLETEWEQGPVSDFKEVQRGWKFAEKDREEINKIILRNKKRSAPSKSHK